MSISSEVRRAGPYSGNGSTTAFAFAFKVFTTAQVVVTRTVSGVETTLTLTTDYTVSLNANQNTNPGGTVTMLTAPATGQSLTITSNVANLQPTAIANLGGFYPEVINDSLDRATIQIQQLDERLDRALVIPVSSSGVSTQLPAPEINKVLGWNGTGTAVINYTTLPPSGEIYPVATYAALTATPVANLQDDMLFYVASRSTDGDGGHGVWRYDAASTATANGGTILARDAGGAGRFVRLYTKGEIWAAWFGLTLNSVAGAVPANNTTAVNAAMAACAADLGGTVHCPGTGGNSGYIAFEGVVDNIYDNVLLKGAPSFSRWSDGGSAPNYSTTFLPTTAGSVFKRRSPLGASNARTIGGGFDGIRIIGNNIATRLLEVRAVIGAKFHMQLQDAVGTEAAKFVSDVTTTDLADYAGIQLCDIHLQIRQDGQSSTGAGITAARAAHCLNIVGSINANFSFNHDIVLETVFYNGHGIIGDGDMNIFRSYRGFNVGGSGLPIYGNGPTAAIPVGWDGNVFQQYSASGIGFAQGTDTSGVTAGVINDIWYLDVGNATPRPTGGTGSRWVIADNIGHQTNLLAENLVMGAALSETNAGRALLTSTMSSLVYNGSQSHQFFATSATPQWKQFIEATTNKMVFQPLYGAGTFGFKVLDFVETTGYYAVSGTQVVGARGAAVADASGGVTIDAEARTAINTLLARLRTHGLIAT